MLIDTSNGRLKSKHCQNIHLLACPNMLPKRPISINFTSPWKTYEILYVRYDLISQNVIGKTCWSQQQYWTCCVMMRPESQKKVKAAAAHHTASKSCIFFSWNDNGLALKQPAGGKLTWWKFEQRAPLATHHRGEPRAAYCRQRIGCVLRGREVRCVASRMRSSHCQTFNIFSRTQATNRLFHFMSSWKSYGI